MTIIKYYELSNQSYWIDEIGKCDWVAARFLANLLRNDSFKSTCGASADVLVLAQGDELISFCTLAEQDEVCAPEMTPWVGFVFTKAEHRGKRYAGKLLEYACNEALLRGYKSVYLSTDAVGLYEKYGFDYIGDMTDIHGNPTRVYERRV